MHTVDKEQGQQYAKKHGARALSVSIYPITSGNCESSFEIFFSCIFLAVGECREMLNFCNQAGFYSLVHL
jgi:hypothetical protein